MTEPLHVGVIGLGPLWQRRYRPALLALRNLFAIAGLCDQIEQRADDEAKLLKCLAVPGPTPLLERREVQALLLLDPQWYRLWPLGVAGRLGKPIFSCSSLDQDDAHADGLLQQIEAARLPLLLEMPPRLAPATRRLRELLAGTLGRPRILLGEVGADDAGQGISGEVALMDLCSELLGGNPVNIQAGGSSAGVLTMQFAEDRLVSITRYAAPRVGSRLRLHVIAANGRATLEYPNRIHWTDADGHHSHVSHLERPLGQLFLEQFYRVVRDREAPVPSLEQVRRLFTWTRAAVRSRAEARRIDLPVTNA